MEQDIRTFLKRFSAAELEKRDILQPRRRDDYWLTARSVSPLIELMKENGVTRLVAEEQNWFLTSDGEFANPRHSIKRGRVEEFPKGAFDYQNKHINPYFRFHGQELSDDQAEELPEIQKSDDPEQIKFGLERDLQRALRINIEQLEPGLKIIDDGSERSVAAGRIDITAEDDKGQLVVIELKAGTAQSDAITQVLSYMGSIDAEGRPVRGILVAHDFHKQAVHAAQAVPNLSLKAYAFQFSFEDR